MKYTHSKLSNHLFSQVEVHRHVDEHPSDKDLFQFLVLSKNLLSDNFRIIVSCCCCHGDGFVFIAIEIIIIIIIG